MSKLIGVFAIIIAVILLLVPVLKGIPLNTGGTIVVGVLIVGGLIGILVG